MAKNVSNLRILEKRGYVIVTINPNIHPLDVVSSAAYSFLDRAYIRIDGHPEKEIIVEIKPKEGKDLEKTGREFNNELLSYSFYKVRSEKNQEVKTAIIQRALLTNDPSLAEEALCEECEEDLPLEDPKGIAVPWEEKYGKNAKYKSPKK